MKSKRHRTILDIIQSEPIRTQDELAQRLCDQGMEVTQATISRDIKELGLIKVPVSKDESRYAPPAEPVAKPSPSDRLYGMLRDTITHIDASLNIIVVRTLPGHAHGVAAFFDSNPWPEVIGTVAGDDTILLVVKPPEAVERLVKEIKKWTEGRPIKKSPRK
ncbi:arginine repressor [Heliorestis acidaminivorans]|uniref:Arginine repressor n=1 Tax=Heliorestis acidaminivorans TaxID=553427 RepID=A0A6I0F3H9_9FIRM|nr:arginine repressor [Heliorestis acidaminivorans]KAB2951690.1 arginine repressor [Heliorestis acidaminivorans]